MEERFVGVSCDIIVEKEGKILLGKRLGKIGAGSWALPGGKLKFGEKVLDCAKRELEEEAGIKAGNIQFLGVVNDRDIPGEGNHYVKFVYHVTSFSGEVINKELNKCEGWDWFDKNNLPEPLFVGHLKLIELYKSGKKIIDE